MVGTGHRGLVRIVVKATVAPDSELFGEELRSGCGELHLVRVSALQRSGWLIDNAAGCHRGHVWIPAFASAKVSDRTRRWLQDARTWLSW